MRREGRVAVGILVGGVVLGLVPSSWLPDSGARRATGARSGSLESRYLEWKARHESRGGDRRVIVRLSSPEGLVKERTAWYGAARLDLLRGDVSVEILDVDGGEPLEVWLVDNLPAPGRSVWPEPGDAVRRLGSMAPVGGVVRMEKALGERYFERFDPDLVVVTRFGEHPHAGALLLGARSLFQRVYTRERRDGGSGGSPPLGIALAEAAGDSPLAASSLSELVGLGADLFFRETFAGNGRTCGSCHPAENDLTLDPAFIAKLPSEDPLFVAETDRECLQPSPFPFPGCDPDDPEGAEPCPLVEGLERPLLLRSFALILENADGFGAPTQNFTMRGVPHTLSMGFSLALPPPAGDPPPDPDLPRLLQDGTTFPPVERTGWSGDGSPGDGSLLMFAAGAVVQHFTKSLDRIAGEDFRLPTDEELLAMEAFQLATGRFNDLDLQEVAMFQERAELGRRIFLNSGGDDTIVAGKCNLCHENAGALSPFGGNRNFNTGVELVLHPARDLDRFPFDGGFGASPPFDTDGDGFPDSFGNGTFNTPPLVEAADTPPFFHNNVAATLEEAVSFYSTDIFNQSPAGLFLIGATGSELRLTVDESEAVAVFLRHVNAAFNVDLALQRNVAAIELIEQILALEQPESELPRAARLMTLAREEIEDARSMVEATLDSPSDRGTVQLLFLQQASSFAFTAISRLNGSLASKGLEDARITRRYLDWLKCGTQTPELSGFCSPQFFYFGDKLDFVMGEGNLAF